MAMWSCVPWLTSIMVCPFPIFLCFSDNDDDDDDDDDDYDDGSAHSWNCKFCGAMLRGYFCWGNDPCNAPHSVAHTARY